MNINKAPRHRSDITSIHVCGLDNALALYRFRRRVLTPVRFNLLTRTNKRRKHPYKHNRRFQGEHLPKKKKQRNCAKKSKKRPIFPMSDLHETHWANARLTTDEDDRINREADIATEWWKETPESASFRHWHIRIQMYQPSFHFFFVVVILF